MNGDLREPVPDIPEQAFEKADIQTRVQPALHEELRTPLVPELADLAEYLVPGQQVGVGRSRIPVKCAETAAGNTDIGVVHIPVNHEGDGLSGMEPPLHPVSQHPQCRQLGLHEKRQGLFAVDLFPGTNFFTDADHNVLRSAQGVMR